MTENEDKEIIKMPAKMEDSEKVDLMLTVHVCTCTHMLFASPINAWARQMIINKTLGNFKIINECPIFMCK